MFSVVYVPAKTGSYSCKSLWIKASAKWNVMNWKKQNIVQIDKMYFYLIFNIQGGNLPQSCWKQSTSSLSTSLSVKT